MAGYFNGYEYFSSDEMALWLETENAVRDVVYMITKLL